MSDDDLGFFARPGPLGALARVSDRPVCYRSAETWLVPRPINGQAWVPPPLAGGWASAWLATGEIYVGKVVFVDELRLSLRLLGSGEVKTLHRADGVRCAPLGPHRQVDRNEVIGQQKAGLPAAVFARRGGAGRGKDSPVAVK